VYHLTAQGDRYLADWMADLRETTRVLGVFLTEYDDHMAKAQGEYH
jgi:DNA-binding PadR family transcriptional regulator